eukprot:TRINITY_DN102120_c0_g1_i1.p2 TRINITY_DN102120_c0_g1~~TRINITY_DN102120_c0_g1_i1.p2  ORF type:complete len:106 (-),score=20.72 TRINITY_DN102120_c0_g1_i1:278-595(-)
MRTAALLTCVAALSSVALMLTGCREEQCTDADGANDGGSAGNKCLADHCGADASAAACLENGQNDEDCCAAKGTGSCSDGHEFSEGKTCFEMAGIEILTTCCKER